MLAIKGIGANKAQAILEYVSSSPAAVLPSVATSPASRKRQPVSQHKRSTSRSRVEELPSSSPQDKTAQLSLAVQRMQLKLEQLRQGYYAGSAPMVSDEEYDALVVDFRAMVGKARSQGVSVQSAEQLLASVGATPERQVERNSARARQKKQKAGARVGKVRVLQPVRHTAEHGGRLLSLASMHSEEELRSWWLRNVVAVLGRDGQVVVEPKVDGLTLRLSYDSGKLVEVCPYLGQCDLGACRLALGAVDMCRAVASSL
jgi:hypothetical protein